jgi:hypothetical protein
VCLISAFGGSSTSSVIKCRFNDDIFNLLRTIYRCEVDNDLEITTGDSAVISSVSGTHEDSKSNDDVEGFYAVRKTIQVFPKGLDKVFKNLKVIRMDDCELKEIHQSDLKVFPELIYFFAVDNQIEVIEKGLFDFNPKLEVVGFAYEKRITSIDPNVFDNLNSLIYLFLAKIPCVDQTASDSRKQVQEVIKIVKSNCSN